MSYSPQTSILDLHTTKPYSEDETSAVSFEESFADVQVVERTSRKQKAFTQIEYGFGSNIDVYLDGGETKLSPFAQRLEQTVPTYLGYG